MSTSLGAAGMIRRDPVARPSSASGNHGGTWVVRTTTGRHATRPTPARLEQLAATLPRGEALVAEGQPPTDRYAQAWLHPRGLWHLEVRVDADHHWRTLTASTDRVVQTLLDWAHDDLPGADAETWQRDGWQNIMSMLERPH